MGRINILDKHTAELIAAGEVVERPSSVIKELVENSVDAGATAVTVEIKNGGVSFMRVSDNGSGILREDIRPAFIRHATSKVKAEEDLGSIATLGFRGEALASVSSVSHLELITKAREEDLGSRYLIEGGEEISFEDAGCPDGTTFIIRDLFYNVPARMKFLKTDVAEGNSVSNVVDKIALSHPEIAITYIKDQKTVLRTAGDGKLLSAIYSVYGRDFASKLIPVDYTLGGVRVSGYISRPENARPNRNMQNFFINNRYVISKTAMAAISEACKGTVMVGKFPSCVLNIDMSFSAVDVNVHPTKLEVRFVNERPVFDAVYHGVKSALLKGEGRVEAKISQKPQTRVNPFELAQKVFRERDEAKREPTPIPKLDRKAEDSRAEELFKVLDEPDAKPVKSGTKPVTSLTAESDKTAQQNSSENKGTKKLSPFAQELIRVLDEPAVSIPKRSAAMNMADSASPFMDKAEKYYAEKKAEDQASAGAEPEYTVQQKAEIQEDILLKSSIEPQKSAECSDKKVEQNSLPETTEKESEKATEPTPLIDLDKNYYRYIGEAFKTYIIIEKNEKELMLIDKHAAHERIVYEKLKREKGSGYSQLLLTPITIALNKLDYNAVTADLSVFADAGFDIDDFGSGTVIVRSAPQYLPIDEIEPSVIEMAGYLSENKKDIRSEKMEWIYANVACRAAIKGGNRNTEQELAELARRVEDEDIRHCPHGRPVCIILKKYELEKMFGRIE